jgi:HMG (high mobility group) box
MDERTATSRTIKPLKSPIPKKTKKTKEETKAERKTPVLYEPLSGLVRDMKLPVEDIKAYVNRSVQERREEVEESKAPHKIKRPMNSFMLYRKAYQNVAADWSFQMRTNGGNHGIVSQVCGDAWKLEPESIKNQFAEWAHVERVNHRKAHPGYKFTPSQSKTDAPKIMKRKRSLSSSSSDEGSVTQKMRTLSSSSSNEGSVTPMMRAPELPNSMAIYDYLVGDLASILYEPLN